MTDIIARMEYEPEIFTLFDRLFIQVAGETVAVRSFREWRWSLIIRSQNFGRTELGAAGTVGYHRLSFLQSRRIYRAAHHFKGALR